MNFIDGDRLLMFFSVCRSAHKAWSFFFAFHFSPTFLLQPLHGTAVQLSQSLFVTLNVETFWENEYERVIHFTEVLLLASWGWHFRGQCIFGFWQRKTLQPPWSLTSYQSPNPIRECSVLHRNENGKSQFANWDLCYTQLCVVVSLSRRGS